MNKRIFLFLGSAVVIAFLFWYSSVLQGAFYTIVDRLNELALRNEFLAVLVFMLTAAAAAIISPLTNVPLIPIATAIWGTVFTTIFLLSGWLIGGVIAYLIGRNLGRKVVSYFASDERLDRWSRTINEHTNFSTALFLRLALPAELGYAFGIIRYPAGAYMAVTFFSELPFAIISTYASEAVLRGDAVKFLALIGVLLVVVFIAFRITHEKRHQAN